MKSPPETASNVDAVFSQTSVEDTSQVLDSYFSSLLKESEAVCSNYDDSQVLPIAESEDAKTEPDAAINFVTTNTHPAWAGASFEVLLLSLNSLQVAIPLLQIGMVCKIETNLTRLANAPSWFLGLYPYKGKNIKILDTHRLLGDKPADAVCATNYRYFITLANDNYALACLNIEKVAKLKTDMVRWRFAGTDNAWNVGIIPSMMCILLDAEALLANVLTQ